MKPGKRHSKKSAQATSGEVRTFESGRQWFHILFGGALLAASLILGPDHTRTGYFIALLLGLVILHLKIRQHALLLVDPILARFERKNAAFPGQGALMYFAGALFILSFAPFDFALAVIAIVAFGDGFATLVGLHGKWPLPWNPKKKTEGLLAFIFSAAAISSLVLPVGHAMTYAIALGVMETIDGPVDDNLLLPVAAAFLYYAIPLAV